MTLPRPIRGIVTPMITPLLNSDTLDVAGLERLIEHLVEGGVSGVFVLGSTGEAPGLSYRLRREVIDRACAIVDGRCPVFVGITDTSHIESLAVAESAARGGASALVLSPPFYYALSQKMFLGFLERFTPKLPLPVYLYNIPGFTKLSIAPETVRASVDLPNVYGIKDSSGDRSYFQAVVRAVSHRPDFALLMGIEELLAEFVGYGAHGGVCGGSNLYPRLYVKICNAAARGDQDEVNRLQPKVEQISAGLYDVGEPESSYLRGLKCAASMLGFCTGVLGEPYQAFTASERERIRQVLLEIQIPGLTVASAG